MNKILHIGQCRKFWYLSHLHKCMRAAKALVCIHVHLSLCKTQANSLINLHPLPFNFFFKCNINYREMTPKISKLTLKAQRENVSENAVCCK